MLPKVEILFKRWHTSLKWWKDQWQQSKLIGRVKELKDGAERVLGADINKLG